MPEHWPDPLQEWGRSGPTPPHNFHYFKSQCDITSRATLWGLIWVVQQLVTTLGSKHLSPPVSFPSWRPIMLGTQPILNHVISLWSFLSVCTRIKSPVKACQRACPRSYGGLCTAVKSCMPNYCKFIALHILTTDNSLCCCKVTRDDC